MKRILSLVSCSGLVLALSLFTACEYSIIPEIFINDIITVADGKEKVVTAKAKIRIAMPSDKECAEKQEKLLGILGTFFNNVKNPKCGTEQFNNFFEVDVDLPMMAVSKAPAEIPGKGMTAIGVSEQSDGKNKFVVISLILDRNNFKSVLENEFFVSLGPKDLTLALTVNNDLSGEATILVYNAFVSGKPVPMPTYQTLARRDKKNIVLADVMSQYIQETGFAEVLLLRR
ncbi:MAG: hypothetical protein HQK55_07285 [Deltaproteobacteria bacterium]|nr:hypothetical protein [Deltaproteobacteria bacterium]